MKLTYKEQDVANQIQKVTVMIGYKKTIKDRKEKKKYRDETLKEYDLMMDMYKTYLIETNDYTFGKKYKMIKLKALRISI